MPPVEPSLNLLQTLQIAVNDNFRSGLHCLQNQRIIVRKMSTVQPCMNLNNYFNLYRMQNVDIKLWKAVQKFQKPYGWLILKYVAMYSV